MNGLLLENFIQLVSFDQTVRSLELEREALLKKIALIHEQKLRLVRDIEDSRRKVCEFKKNVDSSELVMEMLDGQEADKKKKLEMVSGSKEYVFLKSEIQNINKEQEVVEHELIDAWGALDNARKKLDISTQAVAVQLDSIEREVVSVEEKLKAIDIMLDDHAQKRVAFVVNVPSEILDDYEHMRGIVNNPVVPVSQASCSGCFYPAPISDVLLLRKGKLLPCKSCYRILYFDESVP